jgi:hypothetical protein
MATTTQGPRRAGSYGELTDDALLCHTNGRHALSFPTMYLENQPSFHMLAWKIVWECRDCGTTRILWVMVGRTDTRLVQTYQYIHPDGFLMEGGRDKDTANAELIARMLRRQDITLDDEGFPTNGHAPTNGNAPAATFSS